MTKINRLMIYVLKNSSVKYFERVFFRQNEPAHLCYSTVSIYCIAVGKEHQRQTSSLQLCHVSWLCFHQDLWPGIGRGVALQGNSDQAGTRPSRAV
jgi:hypothetical protein